MNYVAFLLTAINAIVLLQGVVLPAIGIQGAMKIYVTLAVIIILVVLSVMLGWIDLNAGTQRKIIEKNVYWYKPPWKVVRELTFTSIDLPFIVAMAEGTEGELKECYKEAAQAVVDWLYESSFDVVVRGPKPSDDCIKKLLVHIGFDERQVEEYLKFVKERSEYR
ncbi:hypothetical protein IPA_05455 [Ignicoccus pacificus DSM 13166]|uniref:Uncharacterized protein n=1 Tax=Ignicoccus pacificus DSM 13166 TaxID=940294 RepID=A0A977KB95_9CREN|nr:hypothetical protein IPA_05455 [Ignicoccus pacificus DSM 13166]